jgi:uncharacterized LabA/DUF88 family protein
VRRVTFFVDGFNLYYGALKQNPRVRWLDLAALASALRPEDLVRVRYFTARVQGRGDPRAPLRQKLYLSALATLASVSIHFGQFRTHPTSMPLVRPRPGGPATVQVLKTEEKGSDVNLATFLLLDGLDHLYDEAVVISDDSDLVAPIAQANRRFGPVHVVSPRGQRQNSMASAADTWSALPPGVLPACQLPSPLVLPSGRAVERPRSWR